MYWDILSKEERERIKTEKQRQWHTSYAWWPRRMTEPATRVVWLENVVRRRVRSYHGRWEWEYRESSFDILKNNR